MNIKQNIDFAQVMQQLGAIVFCIDKEGKVLDFTGDTSILAPFYNEISSNLFSFFPAEQVKRIKFFISSLSLTDNHKSFCLSFIDGNKELCFEVVISYDDQSLQDNLLISFKRRSTQKLNLIKDKDFESFEDTIRKVETSETDYSSFFENDPVMHITVNPSTNCVVECNKLVVSKLELSNKLDLIGKPLHTIFQDKDDGKLFKLFKKFDKEGFLRNEEIEIITSSGKVISSILYATFQRDKCNNILISRYTLVDISEQKKTHEILLQKRAYLQLLNNQLEQFIYTCSHDLQEPLATIKFAGDVIHKIYGSVLDQKGRNYLKYIDEAVDRLSDQIKILLNHSKIGEDSIKEEVDLKRVVSNAIKDLGKRVDESQAVISVPNYLPKINGYKTELRLLFQNLLSNAIKYKKPDGVPQIIIQVNNLDKYVEFLISDNGIGINQNETEEVFKIFNKVNQNNPNKGSAIGLAHCKKIVQMHSGEIYVKSALNLGSTFVFTLKK